MKCDGECYNCDKALECYPVSRKQELISKRKLAEKAIIRYYNLIEEYDKELAEIESQKQAE